ncbi:MAG: YjbH domain-containing protein [Candidatus Zipacnadales bacterium]
MKTGILILGVIAFIATGGVALGAPREFAEYPQFRYIGGLAGNGWAVNAEGEAGWEGALSQAIPLGYTPSQGSFGTGFHVGAYSGLGFGFDGTNTNGMLAGSWGFGAPGHGMCLTLDAVDEELDLAINLQFQVLKETDSRPAVSVGVLDLLNQRESLFPRPPTDPKARSFYVAATKRLATLEKPLHVTLGFGSDRYNYKPLVGLCYDAHRRVKVLAEYDGWNVNAATAVQLLPRKEPPGIYKDKPVKRDDALILFLGAADLERAVIGISYATRDLF